jgi:RNA polymerase sigma-70 factor, ECF subfamily
MFTIDFDGIARAQCPFLYQRALRLTRNPAQAWDLVQDTFERSLRHFPAQLPVHKVRSWLLVIMRNLFVDRLRSAEAHVRVCSFDPNYLDVAATPVEEDPPRRSDGFQAEDVRACLDRLPPVLRGAYELHEFSGMSYREIADLLGLPATTVGTRILRARRRLSELLLARAAGTDLDGCPLRDLDGGPDPVGLPGSSIGRVRRAVGS